MKCYSGNKIGRGIIIVNEHFDNPRLEERTGAQKDQEYFRDIYHKFNIDCENNDFYNVDAESMDYNIKNFASHPDTKKCSVIFVAISSHGGANGSIDGKNGKINLGNIFARFYDNKPLLSIPKVFLIQACRGTGTQLNQEHDGPSSASDSIKSSNYATNTSDTLIVYATGDGFRAWRDRENGSWFVKDLRDCICDEKNAGRHFSDLLTICTNRVITTHCSDATETPSFQSTLRKFLLFPSSAKDSS